MSTAADLLLPPSALDARYGGNDIPAAAHADAALDLLLHHRSVRAYLPDPLPEGTIETLVAAAQSAASSSNLQPWSVVAVEDPKRKARLAAFAGNQKHIVEAPLLLVWLIDFDRIARLAAEQGREAGAIDFLETFLLGAVDTSLAAQNAVVALEALGLGSVYIGGIRNHPVEVAAELDLPERVFPLFGLVVGHPDPARPAAVKPRLPQTSVLFRETYAWDDDQVRATHRYDTALRRFQREQRMAERNWTEQVVDRTRGPASMAGRDVLRSAAAALGFAVR